MDPNFGLDSVWKSALILACAGLSTLALRRSPAAARHLAWSLGTAGSLVLPLLTLTVPAWTWAVIPPGGEPSLAPEGGPRMAPVDGPRPIPPRVLDRADDPEPGGPVRRARGT